MGGSYFDTMGLHPVLGRLIGPQDDGPKADGVVVLTYRFWSAALHNDPGVLGKTVRLGSGAMGTRTGTVIGVLEPSIPYPAETEIMANYSDQPASSFGDDAGWARTSHDGIVWAAGAGGDDRASAGRSAYGVWLDGESAPGSLLKASGISDQREAAARSNYLRARAPYFWCSWRLPGWSLLSRCRTWRT